MHVRTFVTIDAPADVAWSVLADFAAYDTWNPMCRAMRGRCAEGERISFQLAVGPLRVPVTAEVTRVVPGRSLRWVGLAPRWTRRLAAGEHYFELTPISATQCRLEHGEDFSGLLVPRRATWLADKLRPVYEVLNHRLADLSAQRTSPTVAQSASA